MADASQDFDKIKRNVAKMLSMSAPEADIDAYLQTERLTPQEFQTVATGKAKLGDIRMTQKSQEGIARTLSAGQTMPAEGLERAGLFPFSTATGTGNTDFDPDAGILGVIKRSVMAPGDIMAGKLDPNTPEGARRAQEMAGTITPVSAATRASVNVIPGTLRTLTRGEPVVPSAEALRAAGKAGMKDARGLGVDYSAAAVKSVADEAQRALENAGFSAEFSPKTFSILAKLRDVPEVEDGATALSSLDNIITVRRSLQRAAGDFKNPDEQAAAKQAMDALDDFVVAADPKSVVAGPAAAASALVDESRGNFAAQFRSKRVTDRIEQAELDAAAAGSGNNLDNRTRQLLNSILKSDKESRGFSEEELAAIEAVVRGRTGTNAARYLGNKLGGGGGLASTVASGLGAAAGAALGGVPGAVAGASIPPAAGVSLRALASSMTRKQANAVDELIRKRSPLYKKATENPPVLEGVHPEIRALISRALLLQQLGQEGQQ